jgi:hypothetical protein
MPERGVVGESKARGVEVAHAGVKTLKVGVEAGSVGVVADGRGGGNCRESVDCIWFDSGIFELK